jgi:hypothetical protein
MQGQDWGFEMHMAFEYMSMQQFCVLRLHCEEPHACGPPSYGGGGGKTTSERLASLREPPLVLLPPLDVDPPELEPPEVDPEVEPDEPEDPPLAPELEPEPEPDPDEELAASSLPGNCALLLLHDATSEIAARVPTRAVPEAMRRLVIRTPPTHLYLEPGPSARPTTARRS